MNHAIDAAGDVPDIVVDVAEIAGDIFDLFS